MTKEHSFKEIYKIHLEHKISAEKEKLEGIIPNKDKYKNNNINSIYRKMKI